MANADLIPVVDDVLADKYRIERELGRGGMGIVLSAMHIQLEERVAIKFLLPELAHDPALVARFLREGRAAIKIRSEHVVRVRDVATLPGGTPYMVMEYLKGKNFEELLEEQGRLPVELAVDHLLQATEALAEAHALGMVHRDLKPANLFLAHRADGSPCVKVLDFGITKLADSTGAVNLDATKASIVMGSPRYMSPEQMRSTRTIDARADIWALGVILHELITGASPFDGTTMPDLLAAILQDPPPPLRQRRPDAPQRARGNRRQVPREGSRSALRQRGRADRGARAIRIGIGARIGRPGVARDPAALADGHEHPGSNRANDDTVRLGAPVGARHRGTVTVSATADAWGATGAPARSKVKIVGLAVGGLFFATTLVTALFGAHPQPTASAARPRASETSSILSSPPAIREAEPRFETVNLLPTATPAEPVDPPAASSPPAKAPALVVPKHHAAGTATAAAAPGTPAAAGEIDLFDGRK